MSNPTSNTGGTPRNLPPTPSKENVPELTDDESGIESDQSVEFESYSEDDAGETGAGDTAQIVRANEEPRS
jgi:hypothetical protein